MNVKTISVVIISLSLSYFLTSCALLGGSFFNSTLDPETLSVSNAPELEQISSEPLFYRIHAKDGYPRFLSLIKDCTPAKQKLTPQALARQILVGLEAVTFLGQSEITNGQTAVLLYQLTAELDGNPLALEIASFKRAGCVFDIAIWKPNSNDLQLEQTRALELMNQVAGLNLDPSN